MALTSDLVLKNSAVNSKTFTENKRAGYRVERIRMDTSTQLPSVLVIDHSITQSKGAQSERHLVQVATTELSATGQKVTTVVNLTISVPSALPAGSTAVQDAVCFIGNLIAKGADVIPTTTLAAILQNQS